jgi:hypothetical protein
MPLLIVSIVSLLFFPCKAKEIFSETSNIWDDKLTVTHQVSFLIKDQGERLIEGAEILLIDNDGKVIDVLRTDKRGMAEKQVTVPTDRRFNITNSRYISDRGTITAIINKKGFINIILMEVPVSEADFQILYLQPLIIGGRNEPEARLADIHHIETGDLFEGYSKYFKD